MTTQVREGFQVTATKTSRLGTKTSGPWWWTTVTTMDGEALLNEELATFPRLAARRAIRAHLGGRGADSRVKKWTVTIDREEWW